MLDFLLPPKGIDPKRMLQGAVIAALAAVALAVFWPNARLLSLATALFGGACSTLLLYAPVQRLRVAPERAPAVKTAMLIVSIAGLPFTLGHSATAAELALRFLAGAVCFGSLIVADRMRAIARGRT